MYIEFIISQIINTISLIIASFVLIVSIIKRLHLKTLYKFQTFLFFSEIINCLTKYLQLAWYKCFGENISVELRQDCVKIQATGMIIICLDIFTSFCTLTASLMIALKIFDTLKNSSLFFKNQRIVYGANAMIFALPLLFSSVFGSIQYYFNKHNEKLPFYKRGFCHINCIMAQWLNNIYIGFVFLFILLTIIINAFNVISLCKQFKQKTTAIAKDERLSIDISNKISIASKNVMIFPIISVVIWLLLYLDRIIILCGLIPEERGSKTTFFRALVGINAISNSLRGILFSFLFIYTTAELQVILKNLFFKKTKEELITEDEIQQTHKSFG